MGIFRASHLQVGDRLTSSMAREDVLKYPQRKRNLRPLFYKAVSDTRPLMVITKFKNTPKIELLLKKKARGSSRNTLLLGILSEAALINTALPSCCSTPGLSHYGTLPCADVAGLVPFQDCEDWCCTKPN